jgi:HEPN domain-containing protein
VSNEETGPPTARPWGKGKLVVERLIEQGRLDVVIPDADVVERQLDYAKQHLDSARELEERFPMPAFVNAYDSARMLMTAVLEKQGLRARPEGAHLTVEEAMTAQIGESVGRKFRAIRLLRHASLYPEPGREGANEQSAKDAIHFAETFQEAILTLLPQMGTFREPHE